MSDLITLLHKLEPTSLWTMAPRDLLMRASGLVATGEISAWYWAGSSQLDVEFPRRLDTLICRLRVEGESRITSMCDCHVEAPCQHHIASLMLVCHLLKDFNAFGRFPNKRLAEKLRAVLLTTGLMPQAITPKAEDLQVKHVIIRPKQHQMFAYRLSLSPRAADMTASVPRELQSFVGGYFVSSSTEENFWAWYSALGRTLPVYMQLQHEAVLLQRTPPDDQITLRGRLQIEGDRILMVKEVEVSGQLVTGPRFAIGGSLLYLAEPKLLLKLPNDCQFNFFDEMTSGISINDDYGLKITEQGYEMPLEIWNDAPCVWPKGAGRKLNLELWSNGEAQGRIPEMPVQSHISLMPTEDGRLDVALGLTIADTHTRACLDESIAVENTVLTQCPDPRMLMSKARVQAFKEALFTCWLLRDKKSQAAVIKAISDHPAFKNGRHARTAQYLLRKLQNRATLDESIRASDGLLLASPERGWMLAYDLPQVANELVALACGILGAQFLLHVDDYFDDEPLDPILSVDTHEAMQRLPFLVEECRKRGVALTYKESAITTSSLQMKVSAREEEGMNWFELRPEVWCDGSLIPQDHWEQILLNGHYLDAQGGLRVIDATSADGLRRMSRLLHTQKRENRREEGDEVKVPRLRILDWLELQKHGIQCELPEAQREVLESLVNFEHLQRVPLPKLRATLRGYQHDGYSWLAFHYQHGFGSCLADDMGLGKTLQTIALLAALKEGIVTPPRSALHQRAPHLLVVPPTLLFNWQSEITKFYPELYVHQYTGVKRSLIGIHEGVVLTTYELVRRDIDKLKEKPFDCIIFDEAQAVKNFLGERAQAMRQLNGNFKLVLTGTPLENHAGEYFSIIDLALPGLLGERKNFLALLKDPDPVFNPLNRARPFVLRRTKEKILKELPPKVESDIHLELTEEQKKFYTRAVSEVRAEVMAAFADKTAQQAGIVALAALTRLRQICVSPSLIDPQYSECSPKLSYLCGKLEELRDEGHAALVFSQFTKALDQLEKELIEMGVPYQRLDGSTPQEKRKKLVEAYQDGTSPGVFLISLRAGGAGLNLTRASYVFHLDPWWNPAVENQASDRAHRMGQKKTVFIQRLLMLHTVEEKIMLLKAKKRALFDEVMNGSSVDGSSGGALMTKDDFRFLLE
jgi:superfamily II DNA or RNA helicase